MKPPYYEDDAVTIYHGEALALLRDVGTATLDGVIADPPYSSGGMFRSDRTAKTTDKYRGFSPGAEGWRPKSDMPEFGGDNRDQRAYGYWSALWMSEVLRASKPGAVFLCFTDWRQLPTTSDAILAGGWTWRGTVVWDKGIGRPMKGRPRNHIEFVLWASNGPMNADDNPVYLSSLYRFPPPHARQHLTQKPLELLQELVQFVRPGGVVLDPFMGTGTTLHAAKNTNRRAIGIESQERYCEIAARRMCQGVLDFGEAA